MKISFCPPPLYKCIVVFNLALLLSFTFFSCGGVADNVPDGYGNVRVSFGSSSRNVTQGDKDNAAITVYFNGNQVEKNGDVFEDRVPIGTRLTITAEAVSSGRTIGKGEETITVKSGTNEVQIKIYTYDNFVVTVDGKAEGFTNFTDAWDSASGKTATIKMNANANLTTSSSFDNSKNASLIVSGGNITLDLNGHNITGLGKTSTGASVNVIAITGGTFNLTGNGIIDAKQNGNTSQQNGVICISSGCTFNMYGGTITGGYGEGGGVCVYSNATFNMYGGSITGNKENNTNGGAGVCVYGTFTMNGGSITNNIGTASLGGGVYLEGTFTLNGGVISGNRNDDAGGVFVSSGTFTMNGGTISGNTSTSSGGGVYVDVGTTFNQNGGSVTGNSPDNVFRAN